MDTLIFFQTEDGIREVAVTGVQTCALPIFDAIVEAVGLIKKGKAPRIPQDESKATYEPPCDDRVASMNFEKPIKDIYNLIRGCDPQPGAYTMFKGKRVRFYDAKMSPSAIDKRSGEI